MQPLNPFVKAFFSSKLPAQCSQASNFILFFPTTEHLYTHKEHETQTDWSELVNSEEILASHVVRVSANQGASLFGKDGPSLRDGKGKAKQFSTLNGKTVVMKDNFIYSNKGFKTLNQAQLLHDAIYWPEVPNAQQWLIHYISKPLVGSPEPLFPKPNLQVEPAKTLDPAGPSQSEKPDIKSFKDILDHYPIIARQMQPGLDQLFQQFTKSVESGADAPLPSPTKSKRPRMRRSIGSFSSMTTLDGAQSLKSRSSISREDEPVAEHLRQALENMVASAIETFQGVDKSQLSFLGSSTNLSGLAVEQMIERYVTEFFHDKLLFPRVCSMRRAEDSQLDTYIRQMSDIDLIQAGADIEGGQEGRRELSLRIAKAVSAFRRMGTASSPQEMMEILLETEKCAMTDSRCDKPSTTKDEKTTTVITTNADLLVSMLMIVVIRSSVKDLHARLMYMLEFTFIEEVETGEVGYALSTFEAVLSYLSNNSGGLRRASQANRSFWKAIKRGDVTVVQDILANEVAVADNGQVTSTHSTDSEDDNHDQNIIQWMNGEPSPNGHLLTQSPVDRSPPSTSNHSGLAHVFPFEAHSQDVPEEKPKIKKKVSMDTRSMSSSSAHSHFSYASTLLSSVSIKGETTPEKLCQTQDATGNSALMIAVESQQHHVLQYLLAQEHLFPLHIVLDDCNNDGTTLFSAAVQSGNVTLINTIVGVILDQDRATAKKYISRQDVQGRSAAHYLFNAPQLIDTLNPVIPWQLRDKNGQTPLFALCRSYDHENYRALVEAALAAASSAQSHEEGNAMIDLDAHMDYKFNTLLHVANDSKITKKLLRDCDSDPNGKNDKHFTPLMVASKFARLDSVRTLFSDARIDLHTRDQRGLTAVELAKDDEVRNRIDDMVLLATKPISEGRITTIVRSFFVEDGTIRMIVKSAALNSNSTITVTTCRRSLTDFENLARWLLLEQPASWMLSPRNFRSPFHLPFKPSRTILRDTQVRLDALLKTLMGHPSFSTHEMLWEFFLAPDIDPAMLAQRAQAKATLRVENLREEYTSIKLDAVPEIELFVSHASDQVRITLDATSLVFMSVNRLRNINTDLVDSQALVLFHIDRLGFVPNVHHLALRKHASAMAFNPESYPLTMLHYHFLNSLSTINALLASLARPGNLISSMRASAEQIAKHEAAAQRARNQRWPSALGLLDDARRRLVDDGIGKAEKARMEMENLGRELAYTQSVVAAELAGFWEKRAQKRSPGGESLDAAVNVREALKEFASESLIRERERLGRFKRALKMVQREERATYGRTTWHRQSNATTLEQNHTEAPASVNFSELEEDVQDDHTVVSGV